MSGRTRNAVEPCGTPAAYMRHIRAGETACDPCKAANAEKTRLRAARVTREEIAALITAASPRRRKAVRLDVVSRIEDYLNINGDHLSVRVASRRLLVTPRTILRYRSILRGGDGNTPSVRAQGGRKGACSRWHGEHCHCWQQGGSQ